MKFSQGLLLLAIAGSWHGLARAQESNPAGRDNDLVVSPQAMPEGEEVIYLTDDEAAAWEAEHAQDGDRSPASVKKAAKKAAKKPGRAHVNSGADSEEGWIIRRTEDGRLVKVRAKQTFVFKGSEVQGASNRPSQTLFGQRPAYRPATLIPERTSFRQEFLEASGYTGRGR